MSAEDLPRQCRTRVCVKGKWTWVPKAIYSWELAVYRAEQSKENLVAYPCDLHGWHIGHAPGRRKKK